MRRAAARAASRRGSSSRILPLPIHASPSSASGTSVVFPAPGGATSTALTPVSSARASSGRTSTTGSFGSGGMPPLSSQRGGGAMRRGATYDALRFPTVNGFSIPKKFNGLKSMPYPISGPSHPSTFPHPSGFPHTSSQQLAGGNGWPQPPFRQVWRWSDARWVARVAPVVCRPVRSRILPVDAGIRSRWAGRRQPRKRRRRMAARQLT